MNLSTALNKTPSIFYSINDYQSASRFYYQNIQTSLFDVKRDRFGIDVNPIQITNVRLFSICFMAIDDTTNFIILARTYLNVRMHRSSQSSFLEIGPIDRSLFANLIILQIAM